MESMQNLFETLSELYDKPPLLDEMHQIVRAVDKDKDEALIIGTIVQQRELLIAYEIAMHTCLESLPFRTKYAKKLVDDFLSKQ